eukprot:CAMPEP_0184740082 /NCGR_PEP_ID=MMETSP0315-20130426/3064_1 /TAXON_ID=101924 /ORGANISM="Rhodosorus marinus, Strain UTEX LB 2760" /LENGTH=128 /DNA_ID=CAMNT_0027209489 /DNA_START=73 /DNA_END=459 /DNA_ORIENTATION=-
MSQLDKAMVDQVVELGNRVHEIRRHLSQITMQLQNAERERAIARLSLNHIDQLPESTNTYKPIGKMFVLENKEDLKRQLNESMKQSAEDSAAKTSLRDQFVTKLKENEAQVEELTAQLQKQTEGSSSD